MTDTLKGGSIRRQDENVKGGRERRHAPYKNNNANLCIMQNNVVLATMKIELAVIPGGLTKKLQPLDISVNRTFKVRLRMAWERWMTDGAKICEWIVDAWANVSACTVVRALAKAGIIYGKPHGNETGSNSDDREHGVFDKDLTQLFISDTEDEDFNGFVDAD